MATGGASARACGSVGLPGANPYKAFYSMVRSKPVTLLKQTLLQQLALHLQQLQQQHPLPPGADAAQHLQQLQQLQQQQAKRYLSDGPGNATVLFEAAQRRTDSEALEVTRLLVEEFGVADPQTTDRMQQTCLFYAAREGHAELCRYLLARGLDPNLRDSVGQTCLFYAAREGRTGCLVVLLQGGGDPNVLDINKQTCLFYASRDNRIEAVKALLQAGADPNIKDTLRRTAWSFAKGNNHTQICALLKNASATFNPVTHHPSQAPSCSSMTTPLDAQQVHGRSSSSLGSASLGGLGEDMHPRKKYRLQYQPLPAEMPDVWVDCPHEKLEEFERLFPSLAVWPPVAASASATAAGAPVPSGSDPSAPAGSSGGGSPVMGGAVDLSAAACIGRCEALMQQWQGGAHALLSGLSKYEGAHIFEKPVDRKMAPGYYDVVVVMRFNDYVAAFNRIYAGLQQVAQRNELHRQQHQPTTQQNSAPLKTEHAEEGAPSAADLPSAAAAPTEPSAAWASTALPSAAGMSPSLEAGGLLKRINWSFGVAPLLAVAAAVPRRNVQPGEILTEKIRVMRKCMRGLGASS
ncbi:uncharacterized protein LOC34621168 [Cyclospora cayetanensis]|uniref:Uncharacterized protein LOC34621168 n=1 Tax=Cyclospora cayetanensis TaxID=88456 RepID=A0A6P6RTB9_9EIME|nr:uncharacterized protein LOC34621168 [Cyclospora cayetanensis]